MGGFLRKRADRLGQAIFLCTLDSDMLPGHVDVGTDSRASHVPRGDLRGDWGGSTGSCAAGTTETDAAESTAHLVGGLRHLVAGRDDHLGGSRLSGESGAGARRGGGEEGHTQVVLSGNRLEKPRVVLTRAEQVGDEVHPLREYRPVVRSGTR